MRDLKAVRSGKLFHQPFLARFSSIEKRQMKKLRNGCTTPFADHGLSRGRMARGRVAIEVTGAPINLLKEFKGECS